MGRKKANLLSKNRRSIYFEAAGFACQWVANLCLLWQKKMLCWPLASCPWRTGVKPCKKVNCSSTMKSRKYDETKQSCDQGGMSKSTSLKLVNWWQVCCLDPARMVSPAGRSGGRTDRVEPVVGVSKLAARNARLWWPRLTWLVGPAVASTNTSQVVGAKVCCSGRHCRLARLGLPLTLSKNRSCSVTPISKQQALRANWFRICVWVWQKERPVLNTSTEARGTWPPGMQCGWNFPPWLVTKTDSDTRIRILLIIHLDGLLTQTINSFLRQQLWEPLTIQFPLFCFTCISFGRRNVYINVSPLDRKAWPDSASNFPYFVNRQLILSWQFLLGSNWWTRRYKSKTLMGSLVSVHDSHIWPRLFLWIRAVTRQVVAQFRFTSWWSL